MKIMQIKAMSYTIIGFASPALGTLRVTKGAASEAWRCAWGASHTAVGPWGFATPVDPQQLPLGHKSFGGSMHLEKPPNMVRS